MAVSDTAVVELSPAVGWGRWTQQGGAVAMPPVDVFDGLGRELLMAAGGVADAAITQRSRHG